MNKYISSKVTLVACAAAALASCASQPEKTKLPVSATFSPDNSLSGQVLKEVNAYRRNIGVNELQRHPGLDRLAQEHCEYLRANRGKFGVYGKNVSHMGFEGRSLVARERYNMMSISENVAAANSPGKDFAPVLVKLWSESKDHNYNMKSDWTHTGVGVVIDDDGTVFSTELFATMSNSQMTMRNRFTSF